MNEYLLIGIALVILAAVARGIQRPERFYEYPYFMSCVFGVFILPQAVSLVRFPAEATPNAVFSTLVMTLLCVLACLAGYRARTSRWIVEHAVIPVDYRRLFQGGVFYVVIAYYFSYLISEMTFEERGGALWTGRVTLYQFASALIYPG